MLLIWFGDLVSNMCAVSALYNYYATYPMDWWNALKLEEFQKLIRIAKQMDEAVGEKDCEDPEKAKLIERVEKQLGE